MSDFFEILGFIFRGIFSLVMIIWPILVAIIAFLAWQNHRKTKWVEKQEYQVLSVKVPKNNEKGPTAAEMMFASLHGILKGKKELKKEGSIQEHLGFEIVSGANSITFYVWTPKHLQDFVEGQIYAQYPTAEVVEVDDYSAQIDIDKDGKDDYIAGCEVKLIRPDYYPIKTFMNFEVDPLAGITGALSKLETGNEKVWIQILTRPVSDRWRNKSLAFTEGQKNGQKKINTNSIAAWLINLPILLLNTFFSAVFSSGEEKASSGGEERKLTHDQEVSIAGIEDKANKLGFQVKIRVLYLAKSEQMARERLRMAAGAFKQFNTTSFNGFTTGAIKTGKGVLDDYRVRLFMDKGFVLNIEEVASLYHLPHQSVETPSIVWTSSKKGEPPANLPLVANAADPDELTVFAETTFRGQPRAFGIKKDDRRRHLYVIGKSGVGKSKTLELMVISDIKKGEGVGVVDPHGELIENIMKNIPKERIDDVIYFNPADREHPIGFNPLETTPELREETASGFISVFKRLFGYSWGPRLEYVLRYTVLALTYSPDATMLGVVRMLTDKEYRKKVVAQVEDPVVKSFWLKEFTTYNDRFATEAVAPILNKVGQFTASPIIRNIVGQTKSSVDFRKAMDEGKILLVDLSTGKIGEDNSMLLGSMIITKLQLAAMTRAKISEEERRDFYLYVDEFQNFATESFATILSEARKYRLSLTLANQYIAQMAEEVRDAVFGNVGTLVSFRVGATDATFLEKEFTPVFDQNDLINLDNQHFYTRMLIDGVTSIPFSAKTLYLHSAKEHHMKEIVELSRSKFGVDKSVIENEIAQWSNVDRIDVEEKIEKQGKTVFEMTNQQLESGEAPEPSADRKKKKKKKNKNRPGQDKPAPDKEELRKIIERVTQPTPKTEKATEPTSPVKRQVADDKIVPTPVEQEKPRPTIIHHHKKDEERMETIAEKLAAQKKDEPFRCQFLVLKALQ